MTAKAARPPKRLDLDALRWFSFATDPHGLRSYTIWQAIWYLLVKSYVDEAKIKKFVNGIGAVESAFCIELAVEIMDQVDLRNPPEHVREYLNSVHPELLANLRSDTPIRYVTSNFDEFMVFAGFAIGPDGLDEALDLLEQRRYFAIEHLALPEVLHTLISREIEKHLAGSRSALQIKYLTHPQLSRGIPLISAKSLDSWRTVNSLIALEDDPDREKPSSRTRSDALTNERKVMAVMIHILAELFPNSFGRSGDPRSPNWSAIETFIGANVDFSKSNFVQFRSRTNILKASYDEVARDSADLVVISPLQITTTDAALHHHYEQVLRDQLNRRRQ